jgi:PQ loop repeat
VIDVSASLVQLRHNFKRGHTEGLSPGMFGLAVLGAASYLASILVMWVVRDLCDFTMFCFCWPLADSGM